MSVSRTAGIVLVAVSAIVFSSAGIFTKGVSAGAWEVIYWRGMAAAGFTLAYLATRGALMAEVRAFRGPALLATVVMASGSAAFIPAFKLTTVANVALIYSAAPFLAAAIAWVALRERPTLRVTLASLAAMVGVFVIVSGSVGQINLTGDLLALWMTLMMATTMVIYRARPDTTAALPAAMGSIVLLPIAIIFGDPFSVAAGELPILIAFGLVFAVASVTLSEGARRLPPAETALLSALEVPLAPLLAWLLLAETPTGRVVAGGGVILCAVLWSQGPRVGSAGSHRGS